jgi:hypothetical protein
MLHKQILSKEKKSNSIKKFHRRVFSEYDELTKKIGKAEGKKSYKLSSKPKFIDIYSKCVVK